ncbi:leucine-rich repeat-containing protein 15-like [Teleopsis dalmanni]|uniref:leucine-rich repeat-containing protein 15-like n=1 Tax=Teleopsis dalmanni TaxID=139649 RepID=UPI0018CF334C|nr:leucine-rich repeat-containing protein 15-like [Teleopsis dalmanni]
MPCANAHKRQRQEAIKLCKPRIIVKDSDLCKKCNCLFDVEPKELDCSGKNLTDWITTDEWNILQKGDVTFETLNFKNNSLKTIPVLPMYPVKYLYLSDNQIDNITIGAFQYLNVLHTLDLSHNKITAKVLVPDVFRGQYDPKAYLPLNNLKELNLGYNDLHSLDADLFEHAPALETLILCQNSFQVIDKLSETAISGLFHMKTLDLSYMELEELPQSFLNGPRELETLILSGNEFDELPETLKLAKNLRQLVLDDNLFEEFNGEEIFPLLPNLRYLSISYMPELKRIGKNAFSDLQNLTTLIASSNPKLSYIDEKAFSKNTTNPLILSYPPMHELYLHNNNLTILPRELFERWDNIQMLDLRFNPWVCDCSNKWLVESIIVQVNATTPNLVTNVECNSPADLKSVPIIDYEPKSSCYKGKNEGTSGSSLVLIGLLVGILISIPIAIGGFALYRRGYFNWLRRGNSRNDNRNMYDRANFSDDFHI